ncbi:hypothetical protein MMC18_003903 [Xylographa bjoerkii]|nr:hypothetical protein [Xylographa bjoerkii]
MALSGKCPPIVGTLELIERTAYYAFLDIALALIPVTFVCSLQLSRKKKTSVCLLLSLGVCAGVCAIIKLTKLPELGARDDTTWNTTPLFIWNANEINLVIIAACIPSLRPLFVTLFGGTVSTPSSRSLSAPASRKKSLPIIVASHDHFHALQPLSRASTVDKYGWRDGDSEKETLPGNNITRTIDLDVESQHPRTSVHFHGDANKEASFVSGEREVVGIAY